MKKKLWMPLISCLLILTLAVPALAGTCIALDGKTYSFSGDSTRYTEDGKTFIIEGNYVRVQEEGKPDRLLPLSSSETTIATEVVGGAESAAASVGVDSMSAFSVASEGSSDAQYAGYSQYARFGLSLDSSTGILYYQGQRVRVFSDTYPLEQNTSVAAEYFDANGIIDVEAVRDLTAIRRADGSYDPSGALTGLRVLTEAEFAARDLSAWTHPGELRDAAAEGIPLTSAQKMEIYAPYAAWGVSYDAQNDLLYYQGKTVRRFLDVRQSNGESFSGGRFQGVMTQISQDCGEIDVTIERDYTRPDANGDGKIIGVQIGK